MLRKRKNRHDEKSSYDRTGSFNTTDASISPTSPVKPCAVNIESTMITVADSPMGVVL